jgi:glutathione peroxidase
VGIFVKWFRPPSVHTISVVLLDGKEVFLKEFKGRKLLFVNTASACGLTPQFSELEKLHRLFREKVCVIGVPCNDFGGQEPLDEEAICDFVQENYGVSFLMTRKQSIKNEPVSPLYKFLTRKNLNGLLDSEVSWNFQKYLCDEKGRLIEVFRPEISVLEKDFQRHL